MEEFRDIQATMPRGETVKMRLAERGTLLGSGSDALWVKEIRKLTESGHQTSVVSTAYELESAIIAPHMFTRWCQENFFAYAMQHFTIDILTECGKEPFTGTEKVVNPIWREWERKRRSANGKLYRRRSSFVARDGEAAAAPDHAQHEKWEQDKAELLEEMDGYRREIEHCKEKKGGIAHCIAWDELSEEDKFMKLSSSRRRLINTIGMIAYRAETPWLRWYARTTRHSHCQRRAHTCRICSPPPADLMPLPDRKTLEIRIHSPSTPASNRRLASLFKRLNATETIYPGRELKLVFKCLAPPSEKPQMVPPNLPRDQDI